MGFFSSRKTEDNDVYQVTVGLGGGGVGGGNDKSVVKVIRSRFVRSFLLVCRIVTHARNTLSDYHHRLHMYMCVSSIGVCRSFQRWF